MWQVSAQQAQFTLDPRQEPLPKALSFASIDTAAKYNLVNWQKQINNWQAQAIEAHDTTGAGDTLAGEVVAHLVAGDLRIDRAVEQGMLAARDLLASRLPPQVRSNRDR